MPVKGTSGCDATNCSRNQVDVDFVVTSGPEMVVSISYYRILIRGKCGITTHCVKNAFEFETMPDHWSHHVPYEFDLVLHVDFGQLSLTTLIDLIGVSEF